MEIWTLVPALVVGANRAAIPRFRRATSAFVFIAARFDDGPQNVFAPSPSNKAMAAKGGPMLRRRPGSTAEENLLRPPSDGHSGDDRSNRVLTL
jgi:hypothetical protein